MIRTIVSLSVAAVVASLAVAAANRRARRAARVGYDRAMADSAPAAVRLADAAYALGRSDQAAGRPARSSAELAGHSFVAALLGLARDPTRPPNT